MFVLALLLVSFALMGEIETGIVSKPLRDFKAVVSDVYLDFDETISTDKLSMHVRNTFCNTTDSSVCNCGTTDECAEPNAMITALKSWPGEGKANITRSLAGGGKEGYVRVGREAAMRSWLGRLRKAGGRVFIVSTSWYPVTGIQWQNFLEHVLGVANYGFDKAHILSMADPGPGISAYKGKVIAANMKKTGATFDKAIFADDSSGNIKTAKDVCNTLHISKRLGMDDTDRDYIEALVSGCFESAAIAIRIPFIITLASIGALLKNML